MNRCLSRVSVSLLFIVLCGCGATDDQKNIVKQAARQIETCKSLNDSRFKIKGKCLVWDLSNNSLHHAHDLLPREMRYDSGPANVTVFLVTAKQSQLVGHYSISGEPAYRQWVDVYIIQAPEMKAVGIYELVSLDPRSSRPVQHTPEYGDPTQPLADWITSLPKEK